MSDSKHGSKSNLNESNMPLLSDEAEKGGDTPEKEVIEMTETEKDDTNEKEKDGKKKKEKKVKEKKPKEKKPKKEPGPSCIDTLTQGLNLTERDDKAINADINVSKIKNFLPFMTRQIKLS